MPNEKTQCKDAEHNFIKVAEERRSKADADWNIHYFKAYIMCCSKCGKTKIIEGAWE